MKRLLPILPGTTELPFIIESVRRAEIYSWFSSLFAGEMLQEEIDRYSDPSFTAFIYSLLEIPELTVEAKAFQLSLGNMLKRPDADVELAADYIGLFLMEPIRGSSPFASCHTPQDNLLMSPPCLVMKELFSQYGFAITEGFSEPSDHLSVQIDFLANLILHTAMQTDEEVILDLLARQAEFLCGQLLNWLPGFCHECEQKDPFGFYASAAKLMIACMRLDLLSLATVTQE